MSDIFEKIDRATGWWVQYAVSPYIEAYNTAYTSYQETLQKQRDGDKAQAEMFVAIASIMSTSIIMATFANYPLSRLSARIALRTLGVDNTRRVIGLYRRGAADPVTAFAFGKSYDLVKATAGDKVKSSVGKLLRQTVTGTTSSLPLNKDRQLTRQVEVQGLVLREFCDAVGSDRSIGLKLKDQCFSEVLRAPFMRTPENLLDPGKLAPKIELGFYMEMILNSDYLMYHSPPDMRTPSSRAGGIDVLPSDKDNYPKSESFASTRGYYRTVEIDRPGGHIQSAIDRLHKQVFGSPFYGGLSLGGMRFGGDKAGELRKAEAVARLLSNATRPATALTVIA